MGRPPVWGRRPVRAAAPARSLRLREQVGVALEVERPALGAGDALADALPALAVTVEVAVLELDARALRCLGDEAHLPFTRRGGIALQLPGRADLPAHEHPVRRL